MARGSAWISALGSLGVPPAAAMALEYAATTLSRRDSRSMNATGQLAPGHGQSDLPWADGEPKPPPGPGALPHGFVPIAEAKSMALLGRWELLDDKMPPCLPVKVLLTMQRRRALGDADADNWMKLYDRAFRGEAESQRLFGRVCEIGAFRAPADLQRAYFWYHRAALQGDLEARGNTKRMAQAIQVSPAVVAEPALVYSGAWRITADLPQARGSTSFFELSESGAASGWMIGNGGKHPEVKSAVPDVQYHGQWAYHKASRTLTFDFSASMSAIAGSRSDIWQIELLGCQTGAVYGRDHRMVSYVLEYAGVE